MNQIKIIFLFFLLYGTYIYYVHSTKDQDEEESNSTSIDLETLMEIDELREDIMRQKRENEKLKKKTRNKNFFIIFIIFASLMYISHLKKKLKEKPLGVTVVKADDIQKLKSLESQLKTSVNQLQRLQKQNEEIKIENSDARNLLTDFQQRDKNMVKENQVLRDANQKLQKSLQDANTFLREQKTEIRRLQSLTNSSEREIQKLTNENQNLEQTLKTKNAEIQNEKKNLEQTSNRLNQEIQNAKIKNQKLEQTLKTKNAEIQNEKKNLTQTSKTKDAEIKKGYQRLNQLNQEIQRLNNLYKILQDENKKIRYANTNLENISKSKDAEIQNAKIEYQKFKIASNTKLENISKTKDAEIQSLKSINQNIESENSDLRDLNLKLDKDINQIEISLKKRNNDVAILQTEIATNRFRENAKKVDLLNKQIQDLEMMIRKKDTEIQALRQWNNAEKNV